MATPDRVLVRSRGYHPSSSGPGAGVRARSALVSWRLLLMLVILGAFAAVMLLGLLLNP